jgi:NAD(P)-dependent dehydrogenase (short-subunit alcohol dehydrogenase family)
MSTVLITGGHKGVGLEAVRRIASQGNNDLLLAGRNMAEVKAVIDELATKYGVKIKGVNLDVSSMASVRSAAASTRDMVDRGEIAPLQVLLLNAGAQFLGPIRYSVDGYELTFATNCLGHFLLLNLLLDKVQEGGASYLRRAALMILTRWMVRWSARPSSRMRMRWRMTEGRVSRFPLVRAILLLNFVR